MSEPEQDWVYNYFNYFTEIEEHFQRARGSGLFLLSTLDWALIESWKNAGVPLEAVRRGIDAAFEKWRSRKSKVRLVNSLAYCAQAVLSEAQRLESGTPAAGREAAPPFSIDELKDFLSMNIIDLERHGVPALSEIAAALGRILSDVTLEYQDLEKLEQRLTALEEKMVAIARSRQSEEDLVAARRELDLQLRPYRSKMSAEQLAMLEKQFLDRKLLEASGLPRLSLFYMR